MHAQSDRCWTAIVLNFDAYWAALPTGGWYGVLAGSKSNVREGWNDWKCTGAWSYDNGRGWQKYNRSAQDHRRVMVEHESETGGMEVQQVAQK